MKSKSEFIGIRTTPDQRSKLQRLAALAGKPGNISAGFCWLLDKVPDSEAGRGHQDTALVSTTATNETTVACG